MKHTSTKELFQHWNDRRGARTAPERADIEPGAIRKALGDVFMLVVDPPARHAFRLAGTRVCALFGRELKGEAFVGLWEEQDRTAISELLGIIHREMIGIVAGATGRTANGSRADLEILLLPLRHRGRGDSRIIGSLGAIEPPFWLGSTGVERMGIGPWRRVEAAYAMPHVGPGLRAAFRAFVVHEGGQS